MAVHGNATLTASSANITTWPSYLEEPLAATIFQILLWSTIAFLGVIGNLLVCIVILRRLKRTSMNHYLLSLAIADLGVLVIIYPVAVCKYIEPFVWLLGETFCLYMIPTEEIFFGASIWSITVIAIERYRNIVGANRYQVWNISRTRTAFGIFAVWLASFLVSCVPLYPIMIMIYDQDASICTADWSNQSYKYTYNIALVIVWYVLPLTVITFTYVKIRQRVKESFEFRKSMNLEDSFDFSKMIPSTVTSRQKQQEKMWRKSNKTAASTVTSRQKQQEKMWRKSNKTARILTPLVILFGVAMFPLNAVRLMFLIKPDIWKNKYYNLVVGLVNLFVIINSSANPLVYYLTSKEFKEAFKKIFKGLRERKNIFSLIRRRDSFPASSVRLSNGHRSVKNCEKKKTFKKSHNDCYTGNSSVNVQYVSCV